jgi:hypothetical protein
MVVAGPGQSGSATGIPEKQLGQLQFEIDTSTSWSPWMNRLDNTPLVPTALFIN